MSQFVHLHNHTSYSLLDGLSKTKDLVTTAKSMGMPAVAITDHGNMFGVIDFYSEALDAGIKPIIGCEMYLAPTEKEIKSPITGEPHYYHLTLLAQNITGYKNLMRLISEAYLQGKYYKPRTDDAGLKKYSDGIICLSGCLQGRMNQWFLKGEDDRAELEARKMLDIFGDRFYIELHNHGLKDELYVREKLISSARKYNIYCVCSNDTHYIKHEDAKTHDVLLCVQTKKVITDDERMRYETEEFYLKTYEQMLKAFPGCEEYLHKTVQIANRCDVEISLGKMELPNITRDNKNAFAYLKYSVGKMGKEKFGTEWSNVKSRALYELGAIEKTGFASYFLIVSDIVQMAREKKIMVGPGRGSVSGSLVAYILGITEVNPLQYGLLFERFLNPERISMPDIDLDFPDRSREAIIAGICEKYGSDHVAQIATFGRMSTKMVLKDTGRALGVPFQEMNDMTHDIPTKTVQNEMNLALAMKEVASVNRASKIHKSLFEHSLKLEGTIRHVSTHAAGVVITPAPVLDYSPVFISNNNVDTIQYDMYSLEKLGLLKMDILGLRTLSVIEDVCAMTGVDISKIPMDDESTYNMFSFGKTIGIFQFESSGMRSYLKKLKPKSIEDLAVMNALYRPGPLENGMVDIYINRKDGEAVEYHHPSMEKSLSATYGIMVYQEQIMQLAVDMAGFTLAQADTLRKAIGKKKVDLMREQREVFVVGCKKNKIDEKLANEIFDMIDKFAHYSFNKSHAVGYSILAYQTMYLKVHYPVQFMCASLISEVGDTERISTLLGECVNMNIKVLPPDVNLSSSTFTVDNKSIRFGLSAIKGLGDDVSVAIVNNRPYKSIYDFVSRVPLKFVNSKKLEAMVGCGLFDLSGSRQLLSSQVDHILEYARLFRGKHKLQLMLDPMLLIKLSEPEPVGIEEVAKEYNLLGAYVTAHPMDLCSDKIKKLKLKKPQRSDKNVRWVGTIVDIKALYDRKKRKMCFVSIRDKQRTYRVTVFADESAKFKDIINIGEFVVYSGYLQEWNGKSSIVLNQLARMS